MYAKATRHGAKRMCNQKCSCIALSSRPDNEATFQKPSVVPETKSITQYSIDKALFGLGYPSTNLDGRRIKLPARLINSGIFAKGLSITYRLPCIIDLVPCAVWQEYLAIRRKELCEENGMTTKMFEIWVEDAMAEHKLDSDGRFQIPQNFHDFLRLDDNEHELTFRRGKIWVEMWPAKAFEAERKATEEEAKKMCR